VILYRLEIREGGGLRVALEEQGARRVLYRDTLHALANRSDLPALQLLIQLHQRACGGRNLDTLSYQLIEIPWSRASEAIRAMASTERLYTGRQRLVLSGPQKVWWRAERRPDSEALFSPYLGQQPLDSSFVLRPGWAIRAANWIELETNVPWKWIERFQSGPVVLGGSALQRFLEEDPPVEWSAVASSPIQVLPELWLTDESGCFANLQLDYPEVGRIAFEDLSPMVGGRARLKNEEAVWEKDLLETGFEKKVVGNSHYYCPSLRARAALQFLLEIGWKCFDFRGRRIGLQTNTQWALKEGREAFLFEGNIRFQEGLLSPRSAWSAAARGKFLVELDNQQVGLLDFSSLPSIDGVWESEDVLKVARTRVRDLLALCERTDVEWDPLLKKALDSLRTQRPVPSALDDRFCGTLLPYQQEGVSWLCLLHGWGLGALLADEMGLGKTVQAVAFFSQLRTNLPILIVAPSSLLFQWQREVIRFWPSASVFLYETGRSYSGEAVILVSYSLLRSHFEWFAQLEFEVVALDEAQAIKTHSSQAARAAYDLRARFRLSITGTPLENRAEELWSQFHFLIPDLLGDRGAFASLPLATVQRRVQPFILRRTKKEVQIQLPDKMDQPLWIAMGAAQRRSYTEQLQQVRSGVLQKVSAEGIAAHRMEVLEAILRLRQLSADPRLVGKEDRGAKAEQALETILTLHKESKKVLVFSQFTAFLRLLRKDLEEAGCPFLYLDGETPPQERGPIVDRFQNDSSIAVFLLSLKAGGVGLNLTAAEWVLLLDPWWNDAVEQQAIDRAHRIGQTKTVMVQRFLTPDSIEEKMVLLKAKKKGLAEQILDDESPSSWTEEELIDLF
jgi:superfamily II DNA or RNA helicase